MAVRSKSPAADEFNPKVLELVDAVTTFATSWPTVAAEQRAPKLAKLKADVADIDKAVEAIWTKQNLSGSPARANNEASRQ